MPSHLPVRRTALSALGIAALLLPAAPALAAAPASSASSARPAASGSAQALAEKVNGKLMYTAAPGQANRVTVTMDQGPDSGDDTVPFIYTIDDVYSISAGDGCEHPVPTDLTKVTCNVVGQDSQDPYEIMKMVLGDKDDTLRFHNNTNQAYWANSFWLGPGNDKADTTQPDGKIDGSAVLGQDGNDVIRTGAGGDLSFVLGGNGNDTMYAGDWAHGGNGNDKIYATGGATYLTGDDGNDQIWGSDKADRLLGGPGNDKIWGKKGDDVILGNSGDDYLRGGLGNDTISGGPGKDVIVAR